MKITINPANTHNGIVIEGTFAELESVVTLLLNSSVPLSSVTKAIPSTNTTSNQVLSPAGVPNAMNLIASIYVYRANKNNTTGRGRYIAELIASGKKFTIDELAGKANSTRDNVNRVVKNMIQAGAVFANNGNSIMLVSVPDKKYPRARRSDLKSIERYDSNTQRNALILSTLSGKKIK